MPNVHHNKHPVQKEKVHQHEKLSATTNVSLKVQMAVETGKEDLDEIKAEPESLLSLTCRCWLLRLTVVQNAFCLFLVNGVCV